MFVLVLHWIYLVSCGVLLRVTLHCITSCILGSITVCCLVTINSGWVVVTIYSSKRYMCGMQGCQEVSGQQCKTELGLGANCPSCPDPHSWRLWWYLCVYICVYNYNYVCIFHLGTDSNNDGVYKNEKRYFIW